MDRCGDFIGLFAAWPVADAARQRQLESKVRQLQKAKERDETKEVAKLERQITELRNRPVEY